MYEYFTIDDRLKELSNQAEEMAAPYYRKTEEIQRYTQQKMLAAFAKAGVSESHFADSTGYGYGDRGRDVLDEVMAFALDAEDALVRHNFVSGTHALTVALFGILRPGDTMLSVTGMPYDTIHGVIGIGKPSSGSLKEFGVSYEQVDLCSDGTLDYEAMKQTISPKYRMIYLQRSRGYSLRPSLSVEEIAKIIAIAKKNAPNAIVMVDNCYGEFSQTTEPTTYGADLMAGSLIKNIGGGIAPTGGYLAGKKELIEQCAYRLTTPGTGREIGCTLNTKRELFMGLFHAPHVTGEAMKTAIFASALFTLMGYEVTPRYDEPRADIIQAILLQKPEALIAFCRGIQKGAPIDSFVVPEPAPMPGYDSDVIMAAGAFTLGASVELSADAPLREPYAVWMQGGLNYHSGQLGVLLAAQEMHSQNLLHL
ncbi:methionine gamma-lyase family protein [Scatolibacter rhodanostii]|uniref:methionine gamma-lyase family protein n=1 Tax=Scatolibacter rhodanostii TaxID=2014781 RepID=UPI000C078CB8|nr:aminotransferase class V-fold PLP-dependent enzyme [Scatolibacter rhodanostii]